MKKWFRPRRHGVLYPLRDGVHWLVAEGADTGLTIRAGGVVPTHGEADGMPAGAAVEALLEEQEADWSVLASGPLRAALATVPALGPAETAQAIGWEAEKRFRLAELDPIYDYETIEGAGADGGGGNSLLIAVRRSSAAEMQRWVSTLHPAPVRLEPAFCAAYRFACAVVARESTYSGTVVLLLQDPGCAGVTIFRAGSPLLVRPLSHECDAPAGELPLSGELGRQRVREALLYCEDRHPRLRLDALVASGNFAADWLDRLAADCQLPLLPAPLLPRGIAPPHQSAGTGATLYGGLQGFA